MTHTNTRFGSALLILLTWTTPLLSKATALPHINSLPSTIHSIKEQQQHHQSLVSCNNNKKNDIHQLFIPRGGSSALSTTAPAAAASSNAALTSSLQLMTIYSTFLRLSQSISNSISTFWSEADRTKFLLAGAVAGIVSRTVVSPLEVIATTQMVKGATTSGAGGASSNIMSELSMILKNEGVKGFFKGNGANCLKVAPTRGIQFVAFESFKSRIVAWKKTQMYNSGRLSSMEEEVSLHPIERLIAGGFAGMIASSMVYPIEVVKTMLTMYPGKYPGITAAFRGVLAEVGPKGLYAGLGPTLVAMFPYVGVEFMIYETCKIGLEAILKRRAEMEGNDPLLVTLPIVLSLGIGAFAGAAAQTSAHPLDVVRKRLQVQGINGNPVLYKNTIDCIRGISKKEGVQALYKGLRPACVATIPGTAIAYITYETMKTVLGLSSV